MALATIWTPSIQKGSLHEKDKFCELRRKGEKKWQSRGKEKLVLLYFVRAAQASSSCFSFYLALDMFSKKKNNNKQTNKQQTTRVV